MNKIQDQQERMLKCCALYHFELQRFLISDLAKCLELASGAAIRQFSDTVLYFSTVLTCSRHSEEIQLKHTWAKWQTVAVGISKIPGMSAARLAELLRRFKHFGCNRKGHFRGKNRGIYMEVKMFDIGKNISNRSCNCFSATVLRLPPSASQAEQKNTWQKVTRKKRSDENTRLGDLTSERVRTSPPRDVAWVRRRNFGEATTSERNCCIPTLPERRFCEAAMFCLPCQFCDFGTSGIRSRLQTLTERVWLCNSVFLEVSNHFW